MIMIVFLYDGSFEGMLTAIYESYYGPGHPERIEIPDNRQEGLLEQIVWITADGEKARRVETAIAQKLSHTVMDAVELAWMSEDMAAATVVHRFLRYGFKQGPAVLEHEAHPAVNPLLKLSRAVSRERHRLLGLARFVQLKGGIYYCRLEPDFNLLTLLAPHFAERMNDQPWVIHDARRGLAVIFDTRSWKLAAVPEAQMLTLHNQEEEMQRFWREYYHRIAIVERINPNLRRQMMPKKYWKNLTEMQPGDIEGQGAPPGGSLPGHRQNPLFIGMGQEQSP